MSFTIKPGEILGYLGSNGAGLAAASFTKDEAYVMISRIFNGASAKCRRRPTSIQISPGGSTYNSWEGCSGCPRDLLEPKIEEFLRVFSLWDERHDPLSSYSKGMRQKILLSVALLHNADVLILDEPFSGLDVSAALVLRSLLRRLASQGKMILFSSHVLEVVEKVCFKDVILRKGEVVAYDSVDRLQELMSQPSLEK